MPLAEMFERQTQAQRARALRLVPEQHDADQTMEDAQPAMRAEEFVDIVRGLWDSYDDDAFPRDKAKGLRELVESELKGRTLVFCKMKRGVDRLEADLARQGVRVGALHGDMDQPARMASLEAFK